MIDMMAQQLGQDAMAGMLAKQLGVDERTARQAIKIGMPLIVGAMARNASDQKGAESLSGALQRDHDGSLLDNLGGYLQQGGSPLEGDAILSHVLGGDRGRMEQELGKETGLDPSILAKLLPLLAPLVMAYLGREQRQQGFNPGDLAGYLGRERAQFESQGGLPRMAPPSTQLPQMPSKPERSGASGMVADMLDQNDDGSIADDAARMGMDFLGKLLGGKKG
jgi:hypothetical protein